MENKKILEVKDLTKYFPLGKGKLKEGQPCVKAVAVSYTHLDVYKRQLITIYFW